MMNKNRYIFIVVAGALSGILLTFQYVNPIENTISLREIVFQLSGSRGEILLGFSFSELIAFSARLLPYYTFELYMGVEIYQHFCTSSIYVFSRVSNRTKWYLKETLQVFALSALYAAIILAVTALTTGMRYQVTLDTIGFVKSAVYVLLYAMWCFIMTMAINLIALKHGSSTAFTVVIAAQILLLTLFSLMNSLTSRTGVLLLLTINPMTRLVIGWLDPQGQSSGNDLFCDMIKSADINPFFSTVNAFCVFLFFMILIVFIGMYQVKHYEVLYANPEQEV
jgi:hypothetical protein